jgi:16S rRNA G966 N2-methylase RsmD
MTMKDSYDSYDSLKEDFKEDKLPRNFDSYEKGPCTFKIGQKIGWWTEEDEKFSKDIGENVFLDPPYKGIVVPMHNTEIRYGIIDAEDAVVIIYEYPVEKCYCESTFISYKRLIDMEEYVKLISID